MDVNLVAAAGGGTETGIGRYVEQLRPALAAVGVRVHDAPFRYPPGVSRRPVLRALPIGIEGAVRGGVAHFAQIMGAQLLLAGRPRPAVVTVHDLGALYCPEDRLQVDRVGAALFRLALAGLRRADRLIAVSEFTRGCLIRAGFPAERVTTVPLGIDREAFRPGPEDVGRLAADYRLDLPPDRPILVYVGNELPRKNLVTLVEALAQLKRDGVPFRWLKVGGPGAPAGRDRLRRRIADLGLEADVSFVERVPDADLARFYRAATVYVQPSVWEGFGLPLLEAMACGAPIVAGRAGSMPEVSGDAALLVEPRSAEELAAGIRTLLEDRDRRDRLREAGLARAAMFSWSATAAGTRAVYESLAAARRTG